MPRTTVQMNVRVPPDALSRWKRAARAAGLPFSGWIRTACDRLCPGYAPPNPPGCPQEASGGGDEAPPTPAALGSPESRPASA
jgi:hypothetical protein